MKPSLFLLLSLIASSVVGEVPARDGLFKKAIEEMYPRLVETRRDIHRNPELSNEEERTAALVAERLRELGFDEVKTGVAKHGVVALLKGGQPGKCVAVRADMDALPIREIGNRPYRSQKMGVMHACGHDVHTTVALGVAELLSKNRDQIKGSVKFLFQPAEEAPSTSFKGDWGAKLMVAEGALENPKPDVVFGLHCSPHITSAKSADDKNELLSAGQLAYTYGPASANSDRFNVVIHGKMAHGSAPHQGVDAIAIAAEAIGALQHIRSRETNTRQPLVITVGLIQGGQRENILAERVEFAGTVRTYDVKFRDGVIEKMNRVLKGICDAHGATYEMNYRKGYPSIMNDVELVKATLPAFQRLVGDENVIEAVPNMGGEDFSYFAQVVPGFFFRLGVANEARGITGGVHTPIFDVDEECMKVGVAAMAAAVCDYLDANAK